jgi:hypothetical protein
MDDNDYSLGLETGNPAASLIPQITMESLGYLSTAAKWTKFLAILGFIGIGILVLLGLFLGVILNVINYLPNFPNFPFPLRWLGLFYFVLAVVYVFPVIYLNNFSNHMTKAVAFRETQYLTSALCNLKKHLKYIGIMTIVGIISYFVIMIGVVIFTMTSAFHSM